MLALHITAAFIALAAGAVALCARKGARLHRKSGMIFVCSMLFMSASGALLAALRHQRLSVVAGVLTFYLVTTALLTVRRRDRALHWIDGGAMLVALGLCMFILSLAFEAVRNGTDRIDGLPVAPGFIFGVVALLGVVGDTRMLLVRGLKGTQRIARHLWRMCFAAWIAAASFFLGQADLFPEPVRKMALLAIPPLLVLLLMFFWLGRVLFTKRYRSA